MWLDSKTIRAKTIELSCKSGAGHLAPSLSTVEILTVLFRDFLRFDRNNPQDENRDRLVFSKGHGCYAYYVVLNTLGILPDEELNGFYETASIKGCLTKNLDYMIEASTGSLGHGLPIAVGMAQAFKMMGKRNKVVCIVGDGEMQEGSNFEALQLAVRFKLDNLLLVVDANGLQAMDRVDNVGLKNSHLSKILNAYTDNFYNIDGHDEKSLAQGYGYFFEERLKQQKNLSILFCNTTKGKGLTIAEDKIAYHFRCPTEDGFVLEGRDG